jgi:hypothetical protein
MIGYSPVEQDRREQLGLTAATGADDPPAWHDNPDAQPETRPAA